MHWTECLALIKFDRSFTLKRHCVASHINSHLKIIIMVGCMKSRVFPFTTQVEVYYRHEGEVETQPFFESKRVK